MNHYFTYLVDGTILTGIALGTIGAFLAGAVVFARIAIAADKWAKRNEL